MGNIERTQTKSVAARPLIRSIEPAFAIPGGDVRIVGSHLQPPELRRPSVRFGDHLAHLLMTSDEAVIAQVPFQASSNDLVVQSGDLSSDAREFHVATLVAANFHPVTNPALDSDGNIFSTLSGERGKKTPVSIYKVDLEYDVQPFVSSIINASGIAFDQEGMMFVSSRHEGTVYRVTPEGAVTIYAESLGIATGLAFDREGSLYVGDRSGTIFKIDRKRETFVFATLEPSVSAYHLAFSAQGDLYVTGPTTSSYDAVYRVTPAGDTTEFFRGLGRPQGMAFDLAGNLYVAASWRGRRGIVRITPKGEASIALSGNNIVGLAFAPAASAIISTTSELFHIPWGIEGRPLYG